MTEITEAPWTEDQVRRLNLWQQAGNVHPFTCGRDHGATQEDRVLTATPEGWRCGGCSYTQDWAFEFMLKPRITGELSTEKTDRLRWLSRKLGWGGPRREDVWHLLDTVDSERIRHASARTLAGERGAKIVRMQDQLDDVRRRVRRVIAAAEGVLEVDIPSRRDRLEDALEDLRFFARSRSETGEDHDHQDDDQHDDQ